MYYAFYNGHHKSHIIYCTFYNGCCKVHNIYYAFYNGRHKTHSIYCTFYDGRCKAHSIYCTFYDDCCKTHSIYYTFYAGCYKAHSISKVVSPKYITTKRKHTTIACSPKSGSCSLLNHSSGTTYKVNWRATKPTLSMAWASLFTPTILGSVCSIHSVCQQYTFLSHQAIRIK
jgi:hypothetical protein